MIHLETLPNGLAVIIEELPAVQSVAYELLIPGGIMADAEDRQGASLILAELTARGAGKYGSQELLEAFDELGVQHGEGAGSQHYAYSGALLSEKLPEALRLVAAMVREPHLPEDEIESIQSLLYQDIDGLEDNPARRAFIEAGLRFYPQPWGRPAIGTRSGIEATTITELRELWQRSFRPRGSILSIAGHVDAPSVLKLVRELFGDWQGDALPEVPFQGPLAIASHHLQIEAAQEQIVAAWPSARFGEPLYYAAKVYNEILSGGMFGRLFIEVREKRGLCYSVMCRHSSARAFGTMFAYAGTTPERAHETLEVTLRELRRLPGTVESEELNRAKGNLKASLVMNQESSGSRANANSFDWWLGKRVRSLDEISQAIDAVTADQIDSVGRTYPPDPVFTLTLGSRDLRSAGGKL